MPVPRVSIVVPNYNHVAFLPERIESIWRQTFDEFELVLLDDASTDGSLAVLQKCAERSNVRLFVNDTNSGSPFHQWNRGVQEARGEYVWIAESDDSAYPELLETLLAILDQNPTVGLAECDSQLIGETGAIRGRISRDAYPEAAQRWRKDFLANGPDEISQFLYLQNTIPSASAVLFRKSAYLAAGPADSSLRLTGDWWQWAKLLSNSDRYFVAQPLNLSRMHSQTQRVTAACNGQSELESLRVQERIRGIVDIDSNTVRAGAERYAASWLQGIRSGRYRGGLSGHREIFRRLTQADRVVARKFAVRFPYAIAAWTLKNSLFKRK